MASVVKRGNSRFFTIKYGAGPNNTPTYHGWAMAGAITASLGDVTRIEAPSQFQYGEFEVVDESRGAQENVTVPITLLFTDGESEVLGLARARCPLDAQIHIGDCQLPSDFDNGWSDGKVIAFEFGHITNYSTTEVGALESGDDSKVDEEIELSVREFYEILPQNFVTRAGTEVEQELVAIVICDTASCGDCDEPSDGCQKIFAISAPAGSSPGKLPEVVFTNDKYVDDIRQVAINTLAVGEDPDDAACVGDYLAVVSNDGGGIQYADVGDLFDGVSNPFSENTGGIIAGGEPNAIDSISPRHTWLVGDTGYVYFTDDITKTLTVLDAGTLTSENLNDVYAYNTQVVVAVGVNNTVLYTVNGTTFQSVTGPDTVGTPSLLTVFARTEKEWWVGTDDGKVYYTTDQGKNWTEHTGITGGGTINAIGFASRSVGYVLQDQASGEGRVWRTISGGNTWYIAPEGPRTVPSNNGFNALAMCREEVNEIYIAGEGSTTTDGILIKASP